MSHKVALNESELMFIELFRVALSAPTHEERLAAIGHVKHEVVATQLQEINRKLGPDWWVHHEANKELVSWVAGTAGQREDAIYEFCRVLHDYESKNERRLNVAEYVGQMIYLSITDGKFEGVQTGRGIL